MAVVAPVPWRRVPMTAAHAVALLDTPNVRRPHVAWVQFVKDWNRSDEAARRALLKPPAAGGSPEAVAVVASVAHALVDRDGGSIPAWVADARAGEDITTCGAATTSPLGRRVVENAPPTCAQHRVYFDRDLLDRR